MHEMGVSITAPDQYGWLPIHRAAANNRDEIIRLLVGWGLRLKNEALTSGQRCISRQSVEVLQL
jgi:ankyrin repeat protein